MTDIDSLTDQITTTHDMDRDAAREAVTIYASQCGVTDLEQISDADAEAILGAVATSIEDVSARPLDAVADAADTLRRAEDAADHARAARDAALHAAQQAGVPMVHIADAAGISRGRLYAILDQA